MSLLPPFRFTQSAIHAQPDALIGLVVASGLSSSTFSSSVASHRESALETIKSCLPAIKTEMETFKEFFRKAGYPCPLPDQLRMVDRKGFPTASPFLAALLMCELTNGVLMGLQDRDKVSGEIVYDVAVPGESFPGLRGSVHCKADELVLRDSDGIIASYFQGPDRRTSFSPNTESLIFYIFGAPGLKRSAFDAAMQTAIELTTPAAERIDSAVITP